MLNTPLEILMIIVGLLVLASLEDVPVPADRTGPIRIELSSPNGVMEAQSPVRRRGLCAFFVVLE